MTTYYKINGQYISYQAAHDLGYTTYPTATQAYKSAGSNDWGESSASSGLYDGLSGVLISGSFFVEGESGWVDIDALALRGYFPNEAETLTMHNVNDGRESAAAKLESGGEYYYLVQADLNLGWISEDDLPETGWQEGTGSVAFCGNFTTEDDVMSSDVAGGQGYLPTYLVVTPLYESRGWTAGGQGYLPTYLVVTPLYESRGWTAGGNLNVGYLMSDAIENPQDYNVDYEETNRLYGASGTRIAYSDTSIEYKILCAERLGSLWNNADLAWLYLKQFQGNLCAQSGSYEDMPANTDLYSVMYSRKQNPIIIDLKLSSNIPVTFSSNDYWYSMFRSASDQTKAEQYGMTVYNNQLDDDNLSTYDISIIALLQNDNDTPVANSNLSNFYVGSGGGCVRIMSIDAFSTPLSYWRVYISKKNEPKSIELLLGLRYDSGWLSKTFDTNDFWWPGILSDQDKALAEAIGLSTDVQLYQFGGPIGTILYDSAYKYEILGLYSDLAGTQEVQADLSNFYVGPHRTSTQEGPYACICNYAAFNTPSMTWKVRITRIGEPILAYKADGTTSQGAKIGSQYIVDAVDNSLHSEADLNALGWYVTWRLYSNSNNINIRNTPSLSTSTVIAIWPNGAELVGNPYLEQTVDGRTWQTVKFSTDGGTTVQTGYCIVDSQVPITYTTGTAETDVLLANTP